MTAFRWDEESSTVSEREGSPLTVDSGSSSTIHIKSTTPKPSSSLSSTARLARFKLLGLALVLCGLGMYIDSGWLSNWMSPSSLLHPVSTSDNVAVRHELKSNLFVPPLEFAEENKRKQPKEPEFADCSQAPKDLTWEWYPSPQDKREDKTPNKQRLLIAISSGHDKFASLLDMSAHLAKVYADQYDAQVMVLQGFALVAPKGCTPPASHASITKIRMLFHAIDHKDEYDQLLLLDADTLLVDLDFDMTKLLKAALDRRKPMLAAQPVRQGGRPQKPPPHEINAGATLWNLHHPKIADVAKTWFENAKEAVVQGRYRGDQKYLQKALENYESDIHLLRDEFDFSEGTVIQHFLQRGSMTWNDRVHKMKSAYEGVCKQHSEACAAVPRREYSQE